RRPAPALDTSASVPAALSAAQPAKKKSRSWRPQSILYWRRSFFDPDQFFTWLEPKIRFFWTRGFLILSALSILAASMLVWLNWQELLHLLPHALRWETLLLAWL